MTRLAGDDDNSTVHVYLDTHNRQAGKVRGADLLARGEERLGDRAAHLSGDPDYCVHAYLLKLGAFES
jgi:hypothetical protein